MTKDDYLINHTDGSVDVSHYDHKSLIDELPADVAPAEEKKIAEFRPNWVHIAMIIALIIC